MACFSIALDSEREKERSRLVPMQQCYQKVTDWLLDTKEKEMMKSERELQSIPSQLIPNRTVQPPRVGTVLSQRQGCNSIASGTTDFLNQDLSLLSEVRLDTQGGGYRNRHR